MSIQFKSCRGDGDTDKDSFLKGAVYMNVEATDEFKSNFSGWVSPQVRALVYAAPGLLEALWICTEHNALYYGESHNTVIAGRAAIAKATL